MSARPRIAAGRAGRVPKLFGNGHGAHWGTIVEDAARLEAALERIALARQTLRPADDAAPHPATQEAVRRLDTLIAEIRAVLGKDTAD